MIRKLLNYSIETDQLVLLHFTDGQSQRVPFDDVPNHLSGPDLLKVNRAIKLRKDYFRHNNLPGALAITVAAGLLLLVAADYRGVAGLCMHARSAGQAPAADSRAQLIATPTPTLVSTPTATAVPTSTSAPAGDRPGAVPVPAAPPAIDAPGMKIPLPTSALKILDNLPISVPKIQALH